MPDAEHPRTVTLVRADGARDALSLDPNECLAFARLGAAAFEVGEPITAKFDPELAKKDLDTDGGGKHTRKGKAKVAARQSDSQ